MEKSVRSAIQRHLRGWAPYPHVQVMETEKGHRVKWSSVQDILDPYQRVVIDTEGTPARRNFGIVGVHGARKWERSDAHMMDKDPHLLTLQPWAFAAVLGSIAALSKDEAAETLTHLKVVWNKNSDAALIFRMLDAQQLSPVIALHACLDALALASTPDALHEPMLHTAPLARILLGHAMASERKAWACKFGHPQGEWSNMALVAWKHSSGWSMSIVSQDNPRLFSDYHWQGTPGGLVFYDRLPSNAPDDTMISRGSFERYARSYHSNEAMLSTHWKQLQSLCLSKPASIEPDTVWTRPIGAAFKKSLFTSTSISLEYYSALRAFEEQAFDYLSSRAATPEGMAVSACMTIGRSLDAPPKDIADFQSRFSSWGFALTKKIENENFVVDSHVFEGLGV